MSKVARIALVSNTDFSLYNFRMGLMRTLLARGYDVHVVCPDGEFIKELVKEGIHHHPLYMDRKGKNPLREIRTLWQLYRVFRKERFDMVHTFTIKPNIYGNIAAKLAGIPVVINSVTGLGYVFTDGGWGKNLLRWLVVNFYRLSFRFAQEVIFLNRDDFEVFQKYKIVSARKGVVLKGEGIDTGKFSPGNVNRDRVEQINRELSLPDRSRPVVVTLVARLLWDKGIREFIEAAKILKQKYPQTLFLLVGPIDTGNPAAVSGEYLQQAHEGDLIKYLGERRDVPEIMYISDVVTLPSYREGIPRVLLEAMCMEKPIVTTNSVGCKEVVEEGKNGFLVPIKDHVALASAIEKLVNNEELRVKMGKYGREKALREFDERIIVNRTLQIYEELLANRSSERE